MKNPKPYDTPARLLKAIAKMYENTKAKVTIPDTKTDFFKVKAGVLQRGYFSVLPFCNRNRLRHARNLQR